MKIALYIEDGLEQIVLTPQTETEKAILGKLHDADRRMTIQKGSFFQCRGGWMRHGIYSENYGYGSRSTENDESTMLVLRKAEPTLPEPPIPEPSLPESPTKDTE